MVSAKGIVKLTDLGSAVFIDDNYVIEGFSRWYKAPELLMGSKSYDYQVDLWSYGCVMAELVKGVPLMAGINEIDQLARIARILGCPCNRHWKQIIQMPDYNKIQFNYQEYKGVSFGNILNQKQRQELEGFVNRFVCYQDRKYCLDHVFFQNVKEENVSAGLVYKHL